MTDFNTTNSIGRVVLIIQARMGSRRLPGKSMLDLAGAPLVARILERVKRCKKIDEIVLAIPAGPANAPLRVVGDSFEVTVFEGSEENVLDRYYKAAVARGADFIVRLPADNATPEPSEIDRIIEHHLSRGERGFSSNLAQINHSGYPDGIGAEIFDFSLLHEAHSNASNDSMREHVHLNFFDYSTGKGVNEIWCPISTILCPPEFRRPDLVLDVNTYEQYQFMRSLYEALYPTKPEFSIMDIIRWYDNLFLNPQCLQGR